MKYLILVALVLTGSIAYAREDKIEVNSRNAQLGFYNDNTPITGMVFDFPERIYRCYVDTARNEIILSLRIPPTFDKVSSACIVVIDLKTRRVKWSKETKMLGFAISNDYVLLTGGGSAFCYDKNNGERKWKRPEHSDIRYVDKERDIAYSDYVGAINISTGKSIWNKQIFTDDHWDEVKYLDDTTLLVTSAGLHCFNIKNGKGWHYAGVTEKEDVSLLSVLSLAIGITGGIAGVALAGVGFFPLPMTDHTYIHGLCSQIIVEERIVYLATKKELFAVNADNGDKLWSADLPAKKTSQSVLYTLSNDIVMLNKGLVVRSDGYNVKVGDPYLLSSSKVNGRQNYMIDLSVYGPILDNYISHDTLVLLFAKTILKYDLTKGRKIFEQKILSDSMVYNYFIDPSKGYQVSVLGKCTNLADLYPTAKFVNTGRDSIIVYNSAFQQPSFLKKDGLAREYATQGELHMLSTNRSTILMKNNQQLGEITLATPGQYYNGKMYFVEGESLYVVDIDAALK